MIDNIFHTSDVRSTLSTLVEPYAEERILVVLDEHTEEFCWPLLADLDCFRKATKVIIGSGDEYKDIASLSKVWQALVNCGATRYSLVVNVGGGMVCDLGGMAAATFKRGLDCINVPTTLLSMVDASVGGKTAVNFAGLKNEVGVFAQPKAVVISTEFLKTLPAAELLSGYAEMIKHALIADTQMWAEALNFDLQKPDYEQLAKMIRQSVEVKQRIVQQDPTEQSIRKVLNLGHTFGHAFESFFLLKQQPVSHGHAVAAGLVCELYLSTALCGFPTDQMRQTVRFIFEHYGRLPIDCKEYGKLFQLMAHDKKNRHDQISFTLLKAIGEPLYDQHAWEEIMAEALEFYREG